MDWATVSDNLTVTIFRPADGPPARPTTLLVFVHTLGQSSRIKARWLKKSTICRSHRNGPLFLCIRATKWGRVTEMIGFVEIVGKFGFLLVAVMEIDHVPIKCHHVRVAVNEVGSETQTRLT